MSLKQYRAFIKTAELGSISAAALSLGQTQSGITQLISALEKELGVTLFERNRYGIRLTHEGEVLSPYIKDVYEADERMRNAVDTLTFVGATVRIGTFKSVAVNWLPDIIKEYRSVDPDIRIELIDGGYNNMEQTFREEAIDFAFAPLPLNFKCTTLPLAPDRLLAVIPPDHPAASLDSFPISMFASEPVIALTEEIDRDARTTFERSGIKPNIRYRVEDDYAMLAMVEKGLGISIVPELVLSGTEKHVRIMELDPPATREIGIAFPDYSKASAASKKLADFISDWVRGRS